MIKYKLSAVRDLKKLDKSVAGRILNQLETNLSENPNSGQPITGQFKGLFKYRVGDYRIIYTRAMGDILAL